MRTAFARAVRRLPTAALLTSVLATTAVVALCPTGHVALAALADLARERVPGRPMAIVAEVLGPETGPPCPADARFVDEQPRGLRPDVLDAWLRLQAAAAEDGGRLCLNDGKRSLGQQQREFDDAVRKFGTAELAGRYVLPPDRSMHVQGIAVDVQPLASAAWVERDGRALGWCRRYANEYWHFEYDPDHVTGGCPALLPSATGG
ncbi:D-alanyl-D-alanine carboxypeptidase family protein [Pseudonocardia xinjiangensis]|uniref:D-alanyl-D-alanine carboxypeptidase family protein n=1 Tax=Pseudonocardia xinjiangensis TaxID=75289 RepID=UPI003D8BFFA6